MTESLLSRLLLSCSSDVSQFTSSFLYLLETSRILDFQIQTFYFYVIYIFFLIASLSKRSLYKCLAIAKIILLFNIHLIIISIFFSYSFHILFLFIYFPTFLVIAFYFFCKPSNYYYCFFCNSLRFLFVILLYIFALRFS